MMSLLFQSRTTTLWQRVLKGVGGGVLLLVLGGLGVGCGGAGTNGGGNGDDEDGGNSDDTTAPVVPSGLTSDAEDGTVSLSWDAVDEADAYRVYRSESSTDGADGSALDTGISSTTYEDTDLTNGTTYYYRVTAVDEAENESDGSEEVPSTPFASPKNLEGASGDKEIILNWSETRGADTYSVYRDTTSMDEVEGDPLTTGISDTTYVDETAENGTKYYYRVTSINPENEESAASNEIGKTPFSDPPDRP